SASYIHFVFLLYSLIVYASSEFFPLSLHDALPIYENNTVWSYELEPTESGGTRLIESRHAENGVKPISNFLVNRFMGGVPNFEQELLDGMNASLARIKAAAES